MDHRKAIIQSLNIVSLSQQQYQPYFLLTLISAIHGTPSNGKDNGENSKYVRWNDVNVSNNEWDGIQAFLGKNLCEGDMAMCTKNFTEFCGKQGSRWFTDYNYVISHYGTKGLIGVCETDKQLMKAIVCWVRYKPKFDGQGGYTLFEMQFWSDNNFTSHCRYATPE
ncbi:hypothetical protein WDU94_011063 [Cyamophila willieti]